MYVDVPAVCADPEEHSNSDSPNVVGMCVACSRQTSPDASKKANKSVKRVYSTHPSRPDLNHSRFFPHLPGSVGDRRCSRRKRRHLTIRAVDESVQWILRSNKTRESDGPLCCCPKKLKESAAWAL